MMRRQQREKVLNQRYFFISLGFHVGVLLLLILGFDVTTPMAVIENTNQHDVISAVVLGDTAKSKIIHDQPTTPPPPPPPPPVAKQEPQPAPPKPEVTPAPDKDVIALNIAKKMLQDAQKTLEKKMLQEKKLAEKKLAEKKLREEMEKNLMKEMLAQSKQQKKIKQKELEKNFQKTLRESAEKSLRQQLLNEEIKLKGTQSRLSQGVVDKYKALIVQAISENWVVPVGADKKRSSVLLIRVAPGGMVMDVQVTKSSGDPSLDSSARAAVMKSSPLPVPSDSDAFEAFRQFELKVKPENIIDAA